MASRDARYIGPLRYIGPRAGRRRAPALYVADGELLLHRPFLAKSTELAQLQAICNLLGTPSPQIWPNIGDLPLWSKVELPKQPYNDLAALFARVGLAESGLQLLNALLTYDPAQRITAARAAHHPYVVSMEPRAERPRSHERAAKRGRRAR